MDTDPNLEGTAHINKYLLTWPDSESPTEQLPGDHINELPANK